MPKKLALTCIALASLAQCADFSYVHGNDGEFALPQKQSFEKFEAAKKSCAALGDGWGLPDIETLLNVPKELKEKAEKSLYASSTQNPANSDEIYYYSFENSDVNILKKSENLYFVCFRSLKKDENQNRFAKKGAFVEDKKLHLLWFAAEPNRVDFKEAKAMCEAKGARLPHINELFSIAIYKALNEEGYKELFGKTQPKYHWSMDANDDFSNSTLVSGFLRASVASSAKDNKSFVRCVKDAK
jgi:hypothetical protein